MLNEGGKFVEKRTTACCQERSGRADWQELHMKTVGTAFTLMVPLVFALSGCGREKNEIHEAPEHLGGSPGGAPALTVRDSTMPAAPDAEMRRARSEIATDAHAAAENVREAASVVRAEADDAVGESHAELDRSARSLDQLASAIESGAVRGERDLDREFVHVHRALASDQITRARAEMEKHEARSTGEHLREAADHLDRALQYAKQEAEKGGEDVVRNARALADKLTQGAEWSAKEVGQAFDNVAREIERLGKEVEPSRHGVGNDRL
jgi:hypothetical protein